MERAQLALTHPPRAYALVTGLIVTAALVAGCDSVSGIPGDPVEANPAATTTAAASTTTATQAIAPGEPAPNSPLPADAPPVGAVAGHADAVTAVRRWAVDLQNSTVKELQSSCWTIPPATVAEMYAEPQSVLAALATPGTATADTVTWRNRTVTVTVDRESVASGYACGRVSAAGVEPGYDDADARHTVRRYLARATGKPLDAADIEADHPLTCKASPASWDPEGTGNPVAPPLTGNSGKVGNVTSYTGEELRSEQIRGDYLAVHVPVTTSPGGTRTRTFTVVATAEGYCIGDVTI
ncbi:hypothetical protein [Nocardia alba]|uniref:Uncharacterized protein n=1 Tax=Nocardia alba TaxID=225051 RepID=A0A4V2PCD8_9NOCA|nr:hypothetical protein [Nocardia alba]TCK00896.1 hypothetical protein DFR71_1910 [Nocardia alba]